jgi:hypothetical protein
MPNGFPHRPGRLTQRHEPFPTARSIASIGRSLPSVKDRRSSIRLPTGKYRATRNAAAANH